MEGVFVLMFALAGLSAATIYENFNECAQTRAIGEACGGFMNVAGNCAPGLRCVYRPGSTYGEYRTGLCETELCSKYPCGYRQRCVGGKGCLCPAYHCRNKRNHVCGYDGETYRSICHLQKQECARGYYIGIKKMGKCPKTSCSHSDDCEADELSFVKKNMTTERVCYYYGRVYKVGEKVDLGDPCLNSTCDSNGMVLVRNIPGCENGPDEPDIAVDKPAVPGEWVELSPWSSCQGDCCTATRNRTRSCIPPQNEGRKCKGKAVEVQYCHRPGCCEHYSDWSAWSSCSVTCNRGVEVRTRKLLSSQKNSSCCKLQESRVCKNYEYKYEKPPPKHWAHYKTPGRELICHDGPCQLHSAVQGRLFDDLQCHSYCMFSYLECGGSCNNTTRNCSCQITRAKELTTFAYCPWSAGSSTIPSFRVMTFLLALECGCVPYAEESEETDTWEGPVIEEKVTDYNYMC